MNQKNKFTIKKIDKNLHEKGFIPKDLLEQWAHKHNEAMLWVKAEREKIGQQSNQQKLVFYAKKKDANGNK